MGDGPCVLVLGMHRSGTSCLTGVLEQCGLFLGGVSRRGRFNRKGNLEVRAIWKLNDAILAAAGGSWVAPPDAIPVTPEHQELIRHVTALYRRLRPSAIKDPRVLLLLDAWQSAVGPSCRLVGTFRHPLAVAQSLARRDGLSEEAALALWVRYNAVLVREHKARPFPLVPYDPAAEQSYIQCLRTAVDALGLHWNEPGVREFIDTTLNHHPSTNLPVPAQCRDIYSYLVAHAGQPVAPHLVQRARPAPSLAGCADRVPAKPADRVRAVDRARAAVERLWYRAEGRRTDWSHVQHLVVFVGNPRSGTTLVRSLLDAHPQAVFGNEVNLLKRIEDGEDWTVVRGRIAASAAAFRRAPLWEGYRYGVDIQTTRTPPVLVGDKKAGASTLMVLQDAFLIDRLLAWSPVPVKVIHCVRHPLDVIATKTRRNGQPLAWNIRRYFDLEHAAGYVEERLGSHAIVRLHLEDLVSEPREVWRACLTALGLPIREDVLAASAGQCFARPSLTRQQVAWDPSLLEDVAMRMAGNEYLRRYSVEGVPGHVLATA